MKTESLLLAAGLLMISATPGLAQVSSSVPVDVGTQIKGQCAKLFPTSYSMQAACQQQESDAFGKIGRAPAEEATKVDPELEAKKAKIRIDSGYRDPPIVHWFCPKPYHIDPWDGCQPPGWKSTRRD